MIEEFCSGVRKETKMKKNEEGNVKNGKEVFMIRFWKKFQSFLALEIAMSRGLETPGSTMVSISWMMPVCFRQSILVYYV